jgi:hypothetical protein
MFRYAKGRPRPQRTGINKTEQAYADMLHLRLLAGEIQAYEYEGVKLRLADKTFYTPDFAVVTADGTLEMHEVKGFWEDDARVKIKVAADKYWYLRFIAAKPVSKKNGGGWSFETFGAGE